MPCGKHKRKRQRGLCFATSGWKDWNDIRRDRRKAKIISIKRIRKFAS